MTSAPSWLMLPASAGGARHLGDGPALARDHGLVDMGGAFDDDAVDAEALARPDEHERAGGHLAHRPARLGATVEHGHQLPVHGQHRRQVAHRPGPPRGLEVAAERVEHQEHRRGVEVDVGRARQRRPGWSRRRPSRRRARSGSPTSGGARAAALPGLPEQRPAQDQHAGRRQRPEQEVDQRAHVAVRRARTCPNRAAG